MFGNLENMLADILTLFQSDVYRVIRFKCHCDICSVSNAEYEDSFCISFIQTGYFEYRTFKRQDDVHAGRILVSKPDIPHTTRHIDGQPDITTTLEFIPDLLRTIAANYATEAGWFLQNKDIHSLVISSDPELDHLHHLLLQLIQPSPHAAPLHQPAAGKLQVDELVMHLLEKIMRKLGNATTPKPLPESLKQYHLPAIEQAQDYLLQHFREDISLQQVAAHCHMSPFHFSRVFKAILQASPHQYLLGIRLHQAKLLLDGSATPVADIAFDCGFNSPEHFATAYRKRYGVSPTSYRRSQLIG
jgi:AraC family transcriptional regulator